MMPKFQILRTITVTTEAEAESEHHLQELINNGVASETEVSVECDNLLILPLNEETEALAA